MHATSPTGITVAKVLRAIDGDDTGLLRLSIFSWLCAGRSKRKQRSPVRADKSCGEQGSKSYESKDKADPENAEANRGFYHQLMGGFKSTR